MFYPSEHYKKPVIYFDWSLRRGVFAVFGEQHLRYQPFINLNDMLNSLREPHVIIGEMTFDSFNLDRRREFIHRAAEEGHIVLGVPTKQTTKARFRLGVGIKVPDTLASDGQDTQAIRYEVQHGMALRPPGIAPDEKYLRTYKAVAAELMLLRSTGEFLVNRNGKPKFTSAKETLPAVLEQYLPDINDRPEWVRKALGSSERRVSGDHKGYNHTALAAIAVLAKHCASRRMLDQVSGLHAHAYGSQARADLMFWVWAGGGKRAKIYTSNDAMMTRDNYGTRHDGLTLTEFRRAVRLLYRDIRNLLDTGTVSF